MSASKMLNNNVSNKGHKSLLEKFDIPIENISYDYINNCTNAKCIENIIRILRSGEEGFYPDLLSFAEKKLGTLKPNSVLLISEKPVITKNMLTSEERTNIETDIENWLLDIKTKEKNLCEENEVPQNELYSFMPKIRNINEFKQKSTKPMSSLKKEKKITSCDYTAWDKYDVDTELNRIDLQEQQQQAQTKYAQQDRKEREEKNEKILKEEKSCLTNTESSLLAEAEKTKGNEAFKAGDYNQALKFYSASITLDNNITSYNNRAMTFIKLKDYSSAYKDCCKVLETEPKNVKALLRRGTALENLKERVKALSDFTAVIKIESNNKEAKEGIKRMGGVLPQKRVRLKIVNENENSVQTKSELTRVPFSYYRSLTYVDLTTNCSCLNLPTCSYHIYPSMHPRNIHCIHGERDKVKNINKTKSTVSRINNEKNNTKIELNLQLCNNNNNIRTNEKVCLKNCLNKTITNNVPPKCSENININEKDENKMTSKLNKSVNNVINNYNNQAENRKNANKINNNVNNNNENGLEEISDNNNYALMIDKIDSPYEFIRTWQALKKSSNTSQLVKLFQSISPEKFVTVVGSNIDSEMWSIIIRCFTDNFLEEKNVDFIVNYFRLFVKFNRFRIMLMFMDDSDKKGLNQIFQFIKKHRPNEIEDIKVNYEV